VANSFSFVGQVELFAFDFAPLGWLRCEGQLLPIERHQPLFALLGFTYGGNGSTEFALPDLRGRVPVGFDQHSTMGVRGGEEAHYLTEAEMPSHNHRLMGDASTAETQIVGSPATVLGQSYGEINRAGNLYKAYMYALPGPTVLLRTRIGDKYQVTDPHENRMPSRALNYCICVEGMFPPHQ
jgi:microcystin-dependent protein